MTPSRHKTRMRRTAAAAHQKKRHVPSCASVNRVLGERNRTEAEDECRCGHGMTEHACKGSKITWCAFGISDPVTESCQCTSYIRK